MRRRVFRGVRVKREGFNRRMWGLLKNERFPWEIEVFEGFWLKIEGLWGKRGFFEKWGFRGFLAKKSGKIREEPGI